MLPAETQWRWPSLTHSSPPETITSHDIAVKATA
jgi:hypothetical protein